MGYGTDDTAPPSAMGSGMGDMAPPSADGAGASADGAGASESADGAGGMSYCGWGAPSSSGSHCSTLASVPFQRRQVASLVSSSRMQAWHQTCTPCTSPSMGSHLQFVAAHAYLGKGSEELKTTEPMTLMIAAPTNAAAMFSGSPVRKKSRTRRDRGSSWDLARTTTLAGVAVGSMNANEHATVAGSSRASGLVTAICEAEASTGSMDAAVPMAEKACAMIDVMQTMRRVRP
mmetsp:Transcript_43690/g.115525  ORF Transcript_43690/g.115525 Transcript_43690/m.115525 type:complete len:232 (+) Transcript_43690:119-814(+)